MENKILRIIDPLVRFLVGLLSKIILIIAVFVKALLSILRSFIRPNNQQEARKLGKDANHAFNTLFPFYIIISLILFVYILGFHFRKHFVQIFGHVEADMLKNNLHESATGIFENASLLIAIVGSVVVVSTFAFQLRESKKQNFRSNFFEYLKIHRENIVLVETRGKKGHDAFVDIYNELKYISTFVVPVNYKANSHQFEWTYLLVFFGVGKNSSPVLSAYLKNKYPEYSLVEITSFIQYFEKKQREYAKHSKSCRYFWSRKRIEQPNLPCILDGHQSDLGHYYRHLYQMVTYIDEFPSLWVFERYDYAKNVRAQFSNHELALFLANSYSPLGKEWIDSGLINKYELVKNLPPQLFHWVDFQNDHRFKNIDFELK